MKYSVQSGSSEKGHAVTGVFDNIQADGVGPGIIDRGEGSAGSQIAVAVFPADSAQLLLNHFHIAGGIKEKRIQQFLQRQFRSPAVGLIVKEPFFHKLAEIFQKPQLTGFQRRLKFVNQDSAQITLMLIEHIDIDISVFIPGRSPVLGGVSLISLEKFLRVIEHVSPLRRQKKIACIGIRLHGHHPHHIGSPDHGIVVVVQDINRVMKDRSRGIAESRQIAALQENLIQIRGPGPEQRKNILDQFHDPPQALFRRDLNDRTAEKNRQVCQRLTAHQDQSAVFLQGCFQVLGSGQINTALRYFLLSEIKTHIFQNHRIISSVKNII